MKVKVGVLTQYPNADEHNESLSGVATFCQYLFKDTKSKNVDLTIFANTENESYKVQENNHIVNYCWKKGLNPFFKVFTEILKEKIQILHIQHELFLYGNILTNLFLFIFIVLCRISHIKVIVEFHAVVPLDKLDKNFTADNRINVPPLMAKCCFLFFYKLVSFFSNRIIVHESLFKTYLVKQYKIGAKKITVVPLPCIQPETIIDKDKARTLLNIPKDAKMIFYFGYISGYKGLEKLIDASHKFLPEIPGAILYIAGGLHPRMKNDEDYLKFVETLKENLDREHTIWHGYVEDKDIPILFGAADVMIFPYSVGMSSSGPLSQAIAYGVPFIVSDAFKGVVLNQMCIYGNTEEELTKHIINFFSKNEMRENIESYARKLKKDRLPERLFSHLAYIYTKV